MVGISQAKYDEVVATNKTNGVETKEIPITEKKPLNLTSGEIAFIRIPGVKNVGDTYLQVDPVNDKGKVPFDIVRAANLKEIVDRQKEFADRGGIKRLTTKDSEKLADKVRVNVVGHDPLDARLPSRWGAKL